MTRFALPLALLALGLTAPMSPAQFDEPPGSPFGKAPAATPNVKPIGEYGTARLEVVPKQAKRNETVTVRLTITPAGGAHTYPFNPTDPEQASKNYLKLPPPGDLIFLPGVTDPAGWEEKPRSAADLFGPTDQVYEHEVTWEFTAVVSPDAAPGATTIDLGKTRLQACKDQCLTITRDELPTAMVEVIDGEATDVNEANLVAALKIAGKGKPGPPPTAPMHGGPDREGPGNGVGATAAPPPPAEHVTRKAAGPLADHEAGLRAVRERMPAVAAKPTEPIGAFVLTAALWGLISLVTPCVFPMIPITVSIFLKQAHGSVWERLKLAGVYCLTIITVLGVSAFALLKFMAWLSAHPVTNLALAALFLVLALSLFGMYELTLPNFMSRRLQAKQAKGGVVGTVFGALAFTVISFTCVAPFLGGFAGISAAGSGTDTLVSWPTSREVAGGLAFATAFAAPFFVLALIPGLLRALPKSGGWLDSVKVVMGFLELAAALKFLRTAELRLVPTPAYFTYDLVLAGWVAIAGACGLYLLNVYRLPHDEERANIGVPRLLFALAFLGFGLYLAPALLKGADGKPQRPAGAVYAWVNAFLLPEPNRGSGGETWGTDLPAAIDRAGETGRPVFVDFTGVTCTNCKYNEENVFPRADVQELFARFERVQLYTDEVPAAAYDADPGADHREDEAYANRQFQVAAFKDSALPLYAVLDPRPDGTVKVLGVYDEGKINSPDRFAAFLKAMLAEANE